MTTESPSAVTGGTPDRHVRGFCPMGCGETLFLASGGYVTCGRLECPRPSAAADILGDAETRHVVRLGDEVFTVLHPLQERLDDALMDCSLHEYLVSLDGSPRQPGRYRVHGEPANLTWEALS